MPAGGVSINGPARENAEARELRAALGVPAHIQIPYRLRIAAAAITARKKEWIADCRAIISAMIDCGAFDELGPDASHLLVYIRSLPARIGPGRRLRLLAQARRLLGLLGFRIEYSAELLDYRRSLVKENDDRRRAWIAISNHPGATLITIDDLVPAEPKTLADAVDRLALLSIESFSGRAQEGTGLPLCLVRAGPRSRFVDRAWSKTDGRTFAFSQEVIDASNLIATFPGCEGRPRIGIDPDDAVECCGDAFIPRLDSPRKRIRPGFYGRQWLRQMLRRRVRAWLKANGIPLKLEKQVLELVTGRALRRGRNASAAHEGSSGDRQASRSNLKTRKLVFLYSSGMNTEGTGARNFLLGSLGMAQRGELPC